MTGEQLRDELARIAESAPDVTVPDDTFSRGRRATTRSRMVAAAVAVAGLALVAGVGATVLDHDDAQVAAGEADLGVPDHLYAPPSYVDDLESDLETGVAAAAFLTDDGLPVVVDADDGAYHLLDLPDITTLTGPGHGVGGRQLALSPDGRQLAWAWAGPAHDGQRASGIRIADLETGKVREVRLDAQRSVAVSQLAWSPDVQWLGWTGHEVREWSDDRFVPLQQTVGGVIADGQTRSTFVTVAGRHAAAFRGTAFYSDASSTVAVSDDGRLAAVVGWSLYADGTGSRLELGEPDRVGGLWFDGRLIRGIVYDGADRPVVRTLPAGRAQTVSTLMHAPASLGLVGPGQVLLHDDSPADSGSLAPAVEMVTWGPGSRATPIIDVEEGVLRLTLADQLIDPDHPTVNRPEPHWPWSLQRKLIVFGGPLATVTVLGLVLLIAVRARRRPAAGSGG